MNRNVNPFFKKVEVADFSVANRATYGGIAIKTTICILLILAGVVSGFYALKSIFVSGSPTPFYFLGIAAIAAFVSAFIGFLFPSTAMVCSLIYSIAEGFLLGIISGIAILSFPGTFIVELACLLTILVFVGMFLLYQIPAVRNSRGLRKAIYVLTSFVLLGIFVVWILSIFGFNLFGNFYFSLIFSIFLTIYAGLSLIVHFDQAYDVVASGCDKKSEWSVAFGLIISIIYIYLQVLQLLMILFSRSSD